MVPLNDFIQSPLEKIQTAACQRFGQALEWPDLGRAIAMRICDRHNIAYPESWLADLHKFRQPDFRRAPMIAAYGLVLDKVSPDIRDAWSNGIEALRGRIPFPRDRGSFAYSPRELLGIACGISSLLSDPRGHADWFAGLIVGGFKSDQFNSPQLEIGALMALHHVDPSRARSTRPDPPEVKSLPMRDLLLVAQLSHAIHAEDVLPARTIEAAFENRLAQESVSVNDAGEAAALIHLTTRMLDSFPFRDRAADPLETVLALCRRFHLFAMQLRRRHAKRPFFRIDDEYDVQDLFHAILVLHFDDVRAEEVTPSFAGNFSRVDFYLPEARLMVEVKMMRKSLSQRGVVTQLTEDAARYAAKSDVDTLVCLVYDPGGLCHNPTALEHDVQESGRKLSVHAVVCPRGM